MNARRLIVAAALTGTLGASLVLPAQGRKAGGSTRAFSIGDRRFVVEDREDSFRPLIERELRQRGLADPLPLELLREMMGPADEVALRETEAPAESMVPLPRGMTGRHAMRLDSEAGPVDIVGGTFERPVPRLREELEAAGWQCADGGEARRFAHRRRGKEAFVVVLEEKEGRFLFLRRMEE